MHYIEIISQTGLKITQISHLSLYFNDKYFSSWYFKSQNIYENLPNRIIVIVLDELILALALFVTSIGIAFV